MRPDSWIFRSGILAVLLLTPFAAFGGETVPIIDAHSQYDEEISADEIIDLMDQAGVSRTILSQRGNVKLDHILAIVSRYPDRITPAVRTKSKIYKKGNLREFGSYLDNQIGKQGFGAMAEVLIYHAEKFHHKISGPIAPEVVLPPDHPRVKLALKRAIKKGWPFVAHIEFAAMDGERETFMSKFESLLSKYPRHPFVLNHVGQLDSGEVRRLIESHENIHFITAMCNPISNRKSGQPLVNLFKKKKLKPSWEKLIVKYPDRFILGFDNVWARHWQKIYVPQVKFWRNVLKGLPADVAHMVAHSNAERLWNLPPAGR
jgi:predicted TIM-barrel fold metal-dependent hydrolase